MTSQINPNNVNGNFPIAGVPNNTQGFRDNFTNIKTNFEFAETEIDELQSKAILKSALSGGTLDNNVGNNLVYNARVQGISGTLVQIANTSGAITLDASAGPYQSIVMGGNINLAFTANTWPSAGAYGKVRVEITGSSGQTITLPSAVTQGTLGIQGINAGVITLAASGTYEFDFSTTDGGASLTVFDLNRPLNYYTNPLTVAATTVSTSAGSGALVVSGGVGINGNLYVSGNIVGSVVATGNTFVGNTTVGNLLTAGFVSATGNVTGGNVLTGGLVLATGNVTGGNVNTGGVVSATGNIAGGNVLTANVNATVHTGITVSVTGNITTIANITGGNVLSSAVVSALGNATILSGTGVPAGGTTGAGYKMSSTTNLGIFFGTGAPSLSAAQGSLYLRTDGSTTNNRLYVNTNGATTWTPVTTAT